MRQPNSETNSGRTRAARRAAGVFYTPPEVARFIVRQTLSPLLAASASLQRPLTVLDPACGNGVFLEQAYRLLLRHRRDVLVRRRCGHGRVRGPAGLARDGRGRWRLTLAERLGMLRGQIYGVDIDGPAVSAARRRLAQVACAESGDFAGATSSVGDLAESLAFNLRCGNALIGPDVRPIGSASRSAAALDRLQPFDWEAAFPKILTGAGAGFDAIVANPPYLNARRMASQQGAGVKAYLRGRYRCARGGFDAYVLFIEKSFELLRPGGCCGVIAPNKLAALQYALPCRKLLIEQTTLRQIVDVSELPVFPEAEVYPYILIWRKGAPRANHCVVVTRPQGLERLQRSADRVRVRQRSLSAENGWNFHGAIDVEARVATMPLGQLAQLHSGATGFAAHELADHLCEQDGCGRPGGFSFIVSGNIDRYRIRLGRVRFMKRDFERPCLPAAAPVLSEAKRTLYRRPKIVIAGMTRRLEAAWDRGGLALGVQVFAVAEPAVEAGYLLALLNSKLLSHLFRLRFQAKHLAGGYLAVNKGQLSRLPIRVFASDDQQGRRQRAELGKLARRLQRLRLRTDQLAAGDAVQRAAREIDRLDGCIDRLVYCLYGMQAGEIAEVEASCC